MWIGGRACNINSIVGSDYSNTNINDDGRSVWKKRLHKLTIYT